MRLISLALVALAASTMASSSASSDLRQETGVFEINLKSFRNDYQRTSNGHCCRGYTTKSGQCSEMCATKFRVCLTHYQSQIDFELNRQCTFGEYTIPSNQKNIGIPLEIKWPGSFSLIIEAWHSDNRTEEALISRAAYRQRLEAGTKWEKYQHIENGKGRQKLDLEYRMVCSAPYYGSDCNTYCKPRNDQYGHYNCDAQGVKQCLPGWQKDSDNSYCTKPACSPGCHPEHGECSKPGECKCRPGWTGPNCDQCKRYPGCKQGTCDKPWECNCQSGWGGLFCDQDLNYCTNHSPCANGATCHNTGQGSYTCSCPVGYTGKNCQHRSTDHVSSSSDFQHCSCENGGTCVYEADGSYQCACASGFTGDKCQLNKDDCALNPCRNGGSCIDLVDDYTCQCAPGFGGANCEENFDDCAHNPCANGGTCVDEVHGFKCYCPTGFTGKDCSTEVNECDLSPCLNNGFCINKMADFQCKCLPGYSGKSCHVRPDGTVDPMYHALQERLSGGQTSTSGSRTAMIACFATIIPVLVIIAVAVLMCNKQRELRDQRRADDAAQKENELNAVASVNKSKMLDDHMIKNELRISRNMNLADEELFASKEATYKQMSTGRKNLNTDKVYCDKLLASSGSETASSTASTASTSAAAAARHSGVYGAAAAASSSGANRSFNDCASTVSSSSSESSSNRSYYSKAKASDLPTAASIQSDVAQSRTHRQQQQTLPRLPHQQPGRQQSQFAIGMERASNYACTQDPASMPDQDLFATEV